jgi:hypothetical protein
LWVSSLILTPPGALSGSVVVSAAAPPPRADDPLPERIGKYRIDGKLGFGGFGTVYLAYDEHLERRVALKVPSQAVLQDPALRARFVAEARAAARMEHEGIARIYEVEPEGPPIFTASEYIDGQPLKAVLNKGPLPPETAVEIAIALALALAHAHAAHVVHRDVKPSNVMLKKDGKVKLIDFGLALLDSSSQSRECLVMGTPTYMSPEQAEPHAGKVGQASDEYSLGVVLYEMLCGRTPFQGDPGVVIHQVIHAQVPRLRELAPGVPEALETICLKALAKDPRHRHSSCRVFARELQRWLDDFRTRSGATQSMTLWASAVAPGDQAPADRKAGLWLRSRDALHSLIRLAAQRAATEENIERQKADGLEEAERNGTKRIKDATRQYEATRHELLAQDRSQTERRDEFIGQGLSAATAKYRARTDWITERAQRLFRAAEKYYREAAFDADVLYEAKQQETKRLYQKRLDQIEAAKRVYRKLQIRVMNLAVRLAQYGLEPPDIRAKMPRRPARIDALEHQLAVVRNGLDEIEARPALRGSFTARLRRSATAAEIAPIYGRVCADLCLARGMTRSLQRGAARRLDLRLAALRTRFESSLNKASAKQQRFVAYVGERSELLLKKAQWFYERQCAMTRAQAATPEGVAGRLAELDQVYREEHARADKTWRARVAAIQSRYRADYDALAEHWRRGVREAVAAIAAIGGSVDRSQPPWDARDWYEWSPPQLPPPVIRFGAIRIAMNQIEHGMPRDERLHVGLPDELIWPALLPFPEQSSLLIETPAAGREVAAALLQVVIMRLLTSLPPGQLRFTIVDPLGLGTDFGAFQQLNDYEDSPVVVRTEAQQILQSLGDLCDHVEKIIQNYLRDTHPSIAEFNALAGEMAEPFRVLVVRDFPAQFDEAACSRLARIVAHGARCGVLTLIVRDSDAPVPSGITLRELATHAVHLVWRNGRMTWNDPDFGPFPLELDPTPPSALTKQVLGLVGTASAAARRVEVPFEFVTPPRDLWWSSSSRAGLEVGLGKAGPTKVQTLVLGRKTAHHVLLAGRTGSGKSSLLHALITNLALHYSPDEVELYLIDFKKGVEFKTYATFELPHARVIAIESEREFGLSVLERLDAELKDRGDRFRAAGVQDLNGYRAIEGLPPLPRTLLIVDEFHEFFIEEDKISQAVSLLLDRLVRQGRAFGIHVYLGSQTLSGAFGLARSTLGQMGVRIALQCSESDAHLILSEENGAARLLSRPGEAIYNDANGRVEGNHFFQVAWLPEDRREEYLEQIRALARQRGWQPPSPQVVFEGNAPAALANNPQLHARLTSPPVSRPFRPVLAWLGESIAIKDPTAASFRRQPGDNLLAVGQDRSAGLGVMAAALVGLASQYPPAGPSTARFYLLDGTPDDVPEAGALARVAAVLPHSVTVAGRREANEILIELAEEVKRRLEAETPAGPDLFLFLCELGRFRELRSKAEYDFGTAPSPPAAASALESVLREGPPLGIYTLVWCDGMNVLKRTFSRAVQQEFGSRIAFQMGTSDSAELLDTPQAGKLGAHRALFLDEEQGRLEKFRPYSLPSRDWLGWVRGQFASLGWLTPTPESIAIGPGPRSASPEEH